MRWSHFAQLALLLCVVCHGAQRVTSGNVPDMPGIQESATLTKGKSEGSTAKGARSSTTAVQHPVGSTESSAPSSADDEFESRAQMAADDAAAKDPLPKESLSEMVAAQKEVKHKKLMKTIAEAKARKIKEDKMEANFKKQHPDFQDDDDLNEETPMLPKVVHKKKTILSKRFWPLGITFGISLVGATVMAGVNHHLSEKKKVQEMTQTSEAFGIGEMEDDNLQAEENPTSAAHAGVTQVGEEKQSLL